jgi:beta-galactosidase
VIAPSDDFSAYRIVIAPDLYLVDAAISKKLEGFVQNGGTLMLGPRAATKDADNRFYIDEPAPGPLRRLAGVTISESTLIPAAKANSSSDEYVPASENNVIGKSSDWPGIYRATEWADVLELHSARSLFEYGKDYVQGQPAVTANVFGRGRVFYFGSIFDEEFYARFAKRVAQDLALDTLAAIPSGVEAVEREDGTHRLLFLLNFAPKRQAAEITGHWEDLLTGRDASGKVTIEPFDIQLLAQTRNAH